MIGSLSALAGCEAQADAPSTETSEAPIEDAEYRPFTPPSSWPNAWEQPRATDLLRVQGKCGATAIANLFNFLPIRDIVSPSNLIDKGVRDLVGTHPDTMTDALAGIGSALGAGSCARLGIDTNAQAWSFLNKSMRRGQPFVALLDDGLLSLHYVTVVGANEADVVLATWGGYRKLNRQTFMRGWNHPLWLRHPAWRCETATRYPLYASTSPWCEKVDGKTACTKQVPD
jgi:hypothetical protein